MSKENPADAGRGQGSGLVVCFPARDYKTDSLISTPPQSFIAARIAQRFGLPPATAAAVAQLAGLGCAS